MAWKALKSSAFCLGVSSILLYVMVTEKKLLTYGQPLCPPSVFGSRRESLCAIQERVLVFSKRVRSLRTLVTVGTRLTFAENSGIFYTDLTHTFRCSRTSQTNKMLAAYVGCKKTGSNLKKHGSSSNEEHKSNRIKAWVLRTTIQFICRPARKNPETVLRLAKHIDCKYKPYRKNSERSLVFQKIH